MKSALQERQDNRQTQLLVNENHGSVAATLLLQGAVLPPHFTPPIPGVVPQVMNQLRNGDLGHSVWTWFETSPVVTNADENEECAWFYSNLAPFNGQEIILINNFTDPATPNTTLKSPDHSDYDPAFCDWDPTDGVARLNGTYTIDAPWPSNIVGPGKTEFIVFILARRSQYVSLPTPFRIFCGVWDNTLGERDFIQGDAPFTLSGGVTNTPAATTERRYKILARTDRGYSFLSDELIVADAPADGAFEPDFVYVALNWTQLPNNQGILSYDVYRFDVVANQYWLLKQVSNGAQNYADQNTILREVTGYPTGTYDRGIAYVATTSGNLSNLPVNGISPAWATAVVPLQIPTDYDQGNTSPDASNQILRIGQNQAADLLLTDVDATSGTTRITSAAAQFIVEMQGLAGLLTYTDLTTEDVVLDTYISATEFDLASPPAEATKGVSLLIIGGGFHGVLLDLVHASFQGGSTWSPSSQDDRVLQPRAAPDGSTQGGTGIGGSGNEGGGDGGIRCLAEGYPVSVPTPKRIIRLLVENLIERLPVKSETDNPNFVYSNEKHWCANLWRVETERWAIECSPSHPLVVSRMDRRGVRVDLLHAGDLTLTETDERIDQEALTVCEPTGRGGWVRQLSLYPRHFYIAGKSKRKRTFWEWLLRKQIIGGFVQSNVKPLQDPTQNQS